MPKAQVERGDLTIEDYILLCYADQETKLVNNFEEKINQFKKDAKEKRSILVAQIH